MSAENFFPISQSMPPPLPASSTGTNPAVSKASKSKEKPHYYRLGIVGSKASGKTCLLASLSMPRTPNPSGCTAVRLPLNAKILKDDESYRLGDEWINAAVHALLDGRWPDANPNEDRRRSLRFEFSDGQTRRKFVDLFDYSGELLNPLAQDSELAEKLRRTLSEVDGLVVLAEHPPSDTDSNKVEHDLNGLLRVFALLSDERRRQVPIALLINKWDRSPHFNPQADFKSQTSAMIEKFLHQTPAPLHKRVADALVPGAVRGAFKIFPVCAIPAVQDEDGSELPPKLGTIKAMGLEDPFLWLIQAVDEQALAEQNSHLSRAAIWWMPPLRPCLLRSDFNSVRSRFEANTPEAKAATRISRRGWLLTLRQLMLWTTFAMTVECGVDFWEHRGALSQIEDSAELEGWERGVDWLRKYGTSNPLRHILYGRFHLAKEEALQKATVIASQKDHEAFEVMSKLLDEQKLQDADKLAKQQLARFPNSSWNEQRNAVLAEVASRQAAQRFEKQVGEWEGTLADLKKKEAKTKDRVLGVLNEIRVLEAEIRNAEDVPLQGHLRGRWSNLLTSVEPVRQQWATRLDSANVEDQFEKELAAGSYLAAADLLAIHYKDQPALLTRYQSGLPDWLKQRTGTLCEQGAHWQNAVTEAGQFLSPTRAMLLTQDLRQLIEGVINDCKTQGDKYFYQLALNERNDKTLDGYLANAPLRSMVQEVAAYRQWLQDRESPRNLIFRLTQIDWHPNNSGQYGGDTAYKLFVAGIGDPHNADPNNDSRVGSTHNPSGLRVVTLQNTKQTDSVSMTFQAWHIGTLGDWVSKGQVSRSMVIESAAPVLTMTDDSSNKVTIKIDGVLPEPYLPDWHLPQ